MATRYRRRVAEMAGVPALKQRIATLEKEVQESRKLNQRLSDVIDVITEVLVPTVDRDDERMRAALVRLEAAVSPPATNDPGQPPQ